MNDTARNAAEAASTTASLFSPFATNGLQVPNRIVMAPMGRYSSPGGVPGPDVAAYYRRRAEGGAGLLITEGTYIGHPSAGDAINCPRVHGERALAGWKHVVDEVHEAGGRIFVQIWHIGITRRHEPGDLSVKFIGPSGLDGSGAKVADPMTDKQIDEVIASFAEAALAAKQVGFDGIELHAAHGYLIDQFMWQRTNQRTDRWGGDIEDRTRFAVEVVKACRKAVGPDFCISFRFSQWKVADYEAKLVTNPGELERLLTPIAKSGVDMFHCSTRRFWEPAFADSDANLAVWTKKVTGLPTIAVGSITLNQEFTDRSGIARPVPIAEAARMIERGDIDLIAVGRSLIADPNWPKKTQAGATEDLLPYHNSMRDSLV